MVWGATVCVFATLGLDQDLLLRANSERLQTSMPEAGFEPADYSTKWQRPTIRPSPSVLKRNKQNFKCAYLDYDYDLNFILITIFTQCLKHHLGSPSNLNIQHLI